MHHLGWVWELQPVDELPLVSLGRERRGYDVIFDGETFINQQGELIIEAPFIIPRYHSKGIAIIAIDFTIYDLNDDGTPEIVIHYVQFPASSHGWPGESVLFSFVDGEFRQMHSFQNGCQPDFWVDDNGQIIANYFGHGCAGYYYLTFVDGRIEVEQVDIPFIDWGLPEIHDILRDLFTELPPLTDLEAQITAAVHQQLGIVIPEPPTEIPHQFAHILWQSLNFNVGISGILVDIDGNGNIGMVVTALGHDEVGTLSRITKSLSYFNDGMLYGKDMGEGWNAFTTTTRDNRLVHVFDDDARRSYTIFKIDDDNGRVVEYLTFASFSAGGDILYLLNGKSISAEEFYEIADRYGLDRDNLRLLTDDEIQAEINYILSMTVSYP